MSRLREVNAVRSSFDGPHLWIHHDANHRKAGPHRHQVFSHIQGKYRPWKRREDNKALRTSSKIRKRDPDEKAQSPKTVLAKGNSDPFGVYPVKIGPEENELVSFYRDIVLPAQYNVKIPITQLDRLRTSDWEDCIGGLTDEGIAHGLFARWGQMVGRCTPDLRTAAIEHQYRSTLLLRKKILRGETLQTYNDYLHITMLFSAETISRNLYGSLSHGGMLRKMFEVAWKRGTLDYKLLIWQVYNDVQTSAIFLVPPVFDVDHFLPMVFAPLRPQAAPHISATDRANDDMDPAVEGLLADHFHETRGLWRRLSIREKEGMTDPVSPEVMIWDSSQCLLFLGRFVTYYLKVKHYVSHRSVAKKLRRQLIVQQYLAIAAAYLVKSLNLNPVVFGVPIFDAAPALLPALRTSLAESDEVSDKSHWQKYKNAQLWALYVGALAEQAFPPTGLDPCQQWFNARLAEHAVEMDLHTWEAVKHVLLGFLYNDRIPPNGSFWFDKTMFYRYGNTGTPVDPGSHALAVIGNFERMR